MTEVNENKEPTAAEPVPAEEKKEADTAQAKEKKKTEKKEKAEQIKLRAELEEKEKELRQLKEELEETKDKYLRTAAEYENFRRRTQKERESLYTDAEFDVLSAILPVADNIERAAAAQGDPESITKGIAMMQKSIEELFGKFGIEKFGEEGDSFDPKLHNAVMHEEDEAKGENEISAIFARGYKKGDKVLRYAMVKTVN